MEPMHSLPEPASAEAPLELMLRREQRGEVLAVEPVPPRALVDALAEYWFEVYLRRGHAELGLGDVRAQLRPAYRESAEVGRYCAGFDLHGTDADGEPASRFFPRECLEHLATHRAERLVDEGVLRAGSLFYYSLRPGAPECTLRGPEGRGAPAVRRIPLHALRARCQETRGDVEGHFPVFVTRGALERAEQVSRKGGHAQPPVETGGLFEGFLGSCPETGELFSVTDNVLEATETQATQYTLAYGGATWARIQRIQRARQANPRTRTHGVHGQCHGHNFLPLGGAAPCEVCAELPVCTRTSAGISSEDRGWCRATFSAEPWQISQIFGLDARSRPVESFWGQRGGLLVRRGYHVIDRFDPDPLP